MTNEYCTFSDVFSSRFVVWSVWWDPLSLKLKQSAGYTVSSHPQNNRAKPRHISTFFYESYNIQLMRSPGKLRPCFAYVHTVYIIGFIGLEFQLR